MFTGLVSEPEVFKYMLYALFGETSSYRTFLTKNFILTVLMLF